MLSSSEARGTVRPAWLSRCSRRHSSRRAMPSGRPSTQACRAIGSNSTFPNTMSGAVICFDRRRIARIRGDEFNGRQGLWQEIVRPTIEACNPAIETAYHHRRQRFAAPPQLLQPAQAVSIRQSQLEKKNVIACAIKSCRRFVHGARHIDGETTIHECSLHGTRKGGLIINQ